MRIRGFPFGKSTSAFLAKHRRCFVVEQNRDAQLRSLLAIETGTPLEKMIPVLDYGGLPLTAGYVVDEISRQLRLLQHPALPGELAGAQVGGAMRGVE
jgi:2-oxoglutarate ferredoxin oxidoreductase subunit alpha